MQSCFFASGRTYAARGSDRTHEIGDSEVLRQAGRDDRRAKFCGDRHGAWSGLQKVDVPGEATSSEATSAAGYRPTNPTFVNRVTAAIIAGRGDYLPVSALPVDGTFPNRQPQGGKTQHCSGDSDLGSVDLHRLWFVLRLCARIRDSDEGLSRRPRSNGNAPGASLSKPWKDKELPGHRLTIQVAPDDCTGCGVCVDVCPAKSKEAVRHKAINMERIEDHLERECGELRLLPRYPRA